MQIMVDKPYSEACERNSQPILQAISRYLRHPATVLEIGSGTGQHAATFARALPHIVWQPSDLPRHHAGIEAWRREADAQNLRPPLALDIGTAHWQDLACDHVFTANTCHIVTWPLVSRLFAGVASCLPQHGLLMIYGPFNYGGQYTSASNAEFDRWLKQAYGPDSGLRDTDALHQLAASHGLTAVADHAMPSNNRLLVWQRSRKAP